MPAAFYAVGVGPGDPELITLKALRILKACDLIGIPGTDPASCHAYQILLQAAPELAQKPLLSLPTPMTKDPVLLEQSYQANASLAADALSKGSTIAAVTLGDPSIYAAVCTLLTRIRAQGYATEMIPGVPSFCAAACALQESLGTRKEAIHILPGSYSAENISHEISIHQNAPSLPGTYVIMKSANHYPQIKELLDQKKLRASLVERCGCPEQKLYTDIKSFPKNAEYLSLIIARDSRTES